VTVTTARNSSACFVEFEDSITSFAVLGPYGPILHEITIKENGH